MSDAKVQFFGLDKKPCAPGGEAYFSFTCPRGNFCGFLPIAGRTGLKRDPQNANGGVAHWDWKNKGEIAGPTFSPSINCKGCWHGYIANGRCVNTAKQDEPEPPRK